MAGIFTGAGNVLMAQCHLENGNCTKQVVKGWVMHCFLIPVDTKHRTHEHPPTDCATCMVQIWCSYNKCGSGQVKVIEIEIEVAICHHHSHEWCWWRDLSLNQAQLHLPSHAVGFATLAMNMSAVRECAAHECQNNYLTSICSTECPLQTLTCLIHWQGGEKTQNQG